MTFAHTPTPIPLYPSTPPSPSAHLVITLGARTRLGRAFLAQTPAHQHILLARHPVDAAALRAEFPTAQIQLSSDPFPQPYSAVTIVACALGLIHPKNSSWQEERDAADRDLAAIAAILAAYPSARVHVIYISSILALTPRRTAWYSGWKNVIDGALIHLTSGHASALLSVLYPGQLREKKSLATFLFTTFDALATEIVALIPAPAPHRRIVGRDARLYLLVRGLPTWLYNLDRKSVDQ